MTARELIYAHRKIVMPGPIDGHGHAGHELLKTLGADSDDCDGIAECMYAHGSTPEYWRADAMLAGLERLESGVTTSVNLFGGGADVYRVDDPRYGDAYLGGIQQVGVRWLLDRVIAEFIAPAHVIGVGGQTWVGEHAQDVRHPLSVTFVTC
jgi:5-methylthioadenosine/S-adenosylhomocysteine deaminase